MKRGRVAFGLVALGWMAGACSNDLGSGISLSYRPSSLVATSQPVVAMALDGSSLYWLDASAGVWSCSKDHCANSPTAIQAPSQSASASANYGGSGVVEQIAVAGGWVFWSFGNRLYGCPTSGCPDASAPSFAGGFSNGYSGGFVFQADSTGVYWYEPMTGAFNRWTSGCIMGASGCPHDVFASLRGMFTSMSPPQQSEGVAVFGGQVYFGDQSGAIDTCSADGCTVSTIAQVRPRQQNVGAGANGNQQPYLLGAGAAQLFFIEGGQLKTCSLPGCTSEKAQGPLSLPPSNSSGFGVFPPVVATAHAFYVPVGGPSLPCMGNGCMCMGGSCSSSALAYDSCPAAGCPSDGPSWVTPDATLDSRVLGPMGTQATAPMAADDSAIYWATWSIFGLPGSQILSMPQH